MTIHFVYATIPGMTPIDWWRGKASRLGLPLSYVGDREAVDTASWPPRAPVSITHHAFQALKGLGRVKLYDWRERVQIRPEPGDVLIGHMHPTDERAVWNRACRQGGFGLTISFMPFVHAAPHEMGRFDPYASRVDEIFAIMGPYWADTWASSAFAHWGPKMTRFDMAIDLSRYPRLKRRFHPPGRRKFLYVGWNGAPKGTRLLSVLFGLARERHRCVWVGTGGPLPDLDWRGSMSLSPERAAQLVEECDVALNLGVADANPTTLLEAMAWGLPVACTPQSGYWRRPEFKQLSTTDMGWNLAALEYFQHAPESELASLADAGRALVEQSYQWHHFCARLVAELRRAAASRGLTL